MTVREIYDETESLLGLNDYGDGLSSIDVFQKDFFICINRVLLDLTDTDFKIKSLRDTIDLKPSYKSVISYGTAMWLALILGDAAKQNILANAYNPLRTRHKSEFSSITDTLPR